MQTFSRTKPSTGWNFHTLRRCDVATLQMLYDVVNWTAKYSTCLDLAAVLTLTASSTAIPTGGTVILTASLKVVDDDAYRKLGGNPVSGRTVTLQRRPVGGTTWITVGTMAAAAAGGTYAVSQAPFGDTEYRATFASQSTEGLNGDTSPTVRVSIFGTCVGAAGLETPLVPCA